VAFRFEGSVSGPRAVAATPALVAVSCWKHHGEGTHAVSLFDAEDGVLLRTLGGPVGSGDGFLSRPYGVRFSASGHQVFVADCENDRVAVFSTSEGAFVRHAGPRDYHALKGPFDVLPVAGGVLVAANGTQPIVFLPSGEAASASDVLVLGVSGFEDGEFNNPTALALALAPGSSGSGPSLFVLEKGSERFQVFGSGTQ
jgi:DNA-binding beta-propeller fold protein YncE